MTNKSPPVNITFEADPSEPTANILQRWYDAIKTEIVREQENLTDVLDLEKGPPLLLKMMKASSDPQVHELAAAVERGEAKVWPLRIDEGSQYLNDFTTPTVTFQYAYVEKTKPETDFERFKKIGDQIDKLERERLEILSKQPNNVRKTHRTRYSESSFYDTVVCEDCGATDATGDYDLRFPCPGKREG